MRSFRTRIRRTALTFMVVLLGLFSVLLYLGLSTILYHHLDEDLLTLAQQESRQVELATGHVLLAPYKQAEHDPEEEPEAFDDQEELARAIRFSSILDRTGTILWSGPAVTKRHTTAPHLVAQILKGATIYETLHDTGRPPLRRISIPIEIEDHGLFILQTEKSLQFVHETLQWLAWLLTGAATTLILFAWWGSNHLAREALAPVDTLSQTAATISGTTLSTRLPLTAPYFEFQRLTEAFNGMLERLQQAFDGQRRFVADAAHELKTPLTAMKGNFEVVLRRPRSPEDYREAILSNLTEVDRLTALTKSLLTLAQFTGEHAPVIMQPVDLTALIRTVVDELSVLANDRDIRLTFEPQPIADFQGDASQLKQALINLLDNALRHTPTGGAITVRLVPEGPSTILSIADTGPGIDARHLPHLFDRFYRVDDARDRQSGGTGLGLAIVKEIVEAHGGQIQVESSPGTGTTFTIAFSSGNHPPSGNTSQTQGLTHA